MVNGEASTDVNDARFLRNTPQPNAKRQSKWKVVMSAK